MNMILDRAYKKLSTQSHDVVTLFKICYQTGIHMHLGFVCVHSSTQTDSCLQFKS